MEILDPTSTVGGAPATVLSPRMEQLAGRRVVGLWNGRQPGPGRAIISGVLKWLDERHGLAGAPVFEKPFYGNAAPDDLLADVAGAADAVVTGVGD